MAITVRCGCGKKTIVADALAGRMMRCPGCGNEVPVVAGGPGAARAEAQARQAGPAFELSRGQIVLICVVGGLLLIGGLFYFGPVRVWGQWAELQPKATENIEDLVIDSLREKQKQEDPDPKVVHRPPTVEGQDIHFFQPILAFSMPPAVTFIGKSNQGTFTGTYNTQTGEVDSTVYYGGYSVAGMVDIGKPRGSFHLKGRMVNGKPEMEMDGQKI